jgi:uncharacterized protein (UPF0332 family)
MLRQDPSTKKWVEQSLASAERFITDGKKNIDIDVRSMTFLAGYNSILQSSRALIFSKGYSEKSHFCMFTAIRTLFPTEKELLGYLDAITRIRETRHKIQYYGLEPDEEMAEYVLGIAEDYLDQAQKTLSKK